jgi:hypothetical protein
VFLSTLATVHAIRADTKAFFHQSFGGKVKIATTSAATTFEANSKDTIFASTFTCPRNGAAATFKANSKDAIFVSTFTCPRKDVICASTFACHAGTGIPALPRRVKRVVKTNLLPTKQWRRQSTVATVR